MSPATENNRPTMQNIVLVGFMGCGKTTIGRILSKKLGYTLVDTDQAIEKHAGKNIPKIFSDSGEDHFRAMETDLLRHLVTENTNHHIISTGGGMVCRPENIPLLRQLGFVVWLWCNPEETLERTSRNSNRPLLQCDDPMQAIRHLMNQRHPLYQQASHLKIDTSALDFNEVSCGIIESASYHFGSSQTTK